jgi:hypothetical protein
MRLPSQFWVKAFLRTVASAGAIATVARHGDDARGAIYVKVSRLDGTAALYVPAPTGLSGTDDWSAPDRLWVLGLAPGTKDTDVEARLAKELRFDSDAWVIEVEDRMARHFLDGSIVVGP